MSEIETAAERRKGKVARLPFELRTQVNVMLRDGAPYAAIRGFLTGRGHNDLSDMNISNWKDGGFQDWLREQERLEEMKFKREFAWEMAKQNEGSKVAEATVQLAMSQIYDVLNDFDTAALKEAHAMNPKLYVKLLNPLAKLSREVLDYEKFRTEVKSKMAEIKDEAKKGGLTPQTIERIERELNLL